MGIIAPVSVSLNNLGRNACLKGKGSPNPLKILSPIRQKKGYASQTVNDQKKNEINADFVRGIMTELL